MKLVTLFVVVLTVIWADVRSDFYLAFLVH